MYLVKRLWKLCYKVFKKTPFNKKCTMTVRSTQKVLWLKKVKFGGTQQGVLV